MAARSLSWLTVLLSLLIAPAQAQQSSVPAAAKDYRLGVDDRVRVTVFGEPSLSNEYPIAPNGAIALPLIGEVPASGKTIPELTADVRTRLADGFIKDPNVSMVIVTFRPFSILGEVSKPGAYPYRDGMTVLGAVATAEGFTYRAQKKYVFLKHEGEEEEIRVPLTATLTIRPGDTIRIGERYF